MIKAKDRVNACVKPIGRVGLKGRTNVRRSYLYYLFLKPYRGKPDVRNFRERVQETWTMEKAKRARKAETPKRPSPHLRSSAPALYSTPYY
jgi:hypothetical protein